MIVLRTSHAYQPTSVVLFADHKERYWSEQSLSAAETLVCQLAWLHRQKQITQLLESTTEDLRQINWYKHLRLEEMYRTATPLLSQIHDVGIPAQEMRETRSQPLLRQLEQATASLAELLKHEQWQLQIKSEIIPVASLLKRAIERVDNLFKEHKLWVGVHGLGQSIVAQLWVGVHGLGQSIVAQEAAKNSPDLKQTTGNQQSSMAIAGDMKKFELVLHELLVAACHRSQAGGRIDIWCRRLDEGMLDISITDNGPMEAQLLHFYQLPDNRVVSRLLLPLVNHTS